MFQKLFALLAGLSVLGMVGVANATLIGDEVCAQIQFTQPGVSVSPNCATVGAGSEFSISTNVLDAVLVDVGDSYFDFLENVNQPTSFFLGDVFILSDLDWIGLAGAVVGATVGELTGVTGLTDINLSFDAHSVTVDLAGVSFAPGSFIRINIATEHIPEPTTLALMALGIAGIGYTRRKTTH